MPVLDKHLQQMVEDFSDPDCKLTAECPETKDNSSIRVNADMALAARVASILTQSVYQTNVERPATDPRLEARELVLEARKDKRYSRATLFGFPADHPYYSGKAMLMLENNTGATSRYLYETSVFDEIDRDMRDRVAGVAVQFDGSAVRLRSKYDLGAIKRDRGIWAGEFLQFGSNTILWRFAAGDPATERAQVELMNATDGRLLQSYSVPEPVRRMEKYSGTEGGDYRLFTPTRVINRDTQNPGWQNEWVVPANITLFTASAQLTGGYDLRFGKFAYAGDDGIHVASQNGAGDRLVLPHSALDTVVPSGEGGGWYLNDPRLMLDGKKLVCAVVNTQTGNERRGFSVSDLDTFETVWFTEMRALDELHVRYINDRLVAAQEPGRITLLDVKTAETGAMPLPSENEAGAPLTFFSEDYKEFLVAERTTFIPNEPPSTSVYRCFTSDFTDRDSRLLTAKGDVFYPIAITENYLIGFCEDSLGLHYTATLYNKSNKLPIVKPRSESASSSSSSAIEAWTEEETLPPDITPEWMREYLSAKWQTSSSSSTSSYNAWRYGIYDQNEFMTPYESWFPNN